MILEGKVLHRMLTGLFSIILVRLANLEVVARRRLYSSMGGCMILKMERFAIWVLLLDHLVWSCLPLRSHLLPQPQRALEDHILERFARRLPSTFTCSFGIEIVASN